MSAWPSLAKGDIVDVVAPAWHPHAEDFHRAIIKLQSWGLVPRVPLGLLNKKLIYANSLDQRREFLLAALRAKDSKAVWCVRGGYGSHQILPALDRLKPDQIKLLLGYSDITSLHLYLNQHWHWPTLHGYNLESLGNEKFRASDEREYKKVLFGKLDTVSYRGLKQLGKHSSNKTIVGQIVGGNLVTVVASLGTPYQVRGRGKIFFFEEIGERWYRLKRLLVQMQQAEVFKGARAVVFGQITGGEEKDGRSLWRPVLEEFAQENKFPVLLGLPCGHGQHQRLLPLGVTAQLTLGRSAQLICNLNL